MSDDEDSELAPDEPPSAHQVARRALALATVCCRGILELDSADPSAGDFWRRASSWWASLSLESELEPHEAALLHGPFGTAPRAVSVNASWRAESLVVLAWALGRAQLPAHDVQADPSAVARLLGFLEPATVLDSPTLRSAAELDSYGNVAFSVHWRLREFSLRRRPMDFPGFCKTAWFGPLSLDGVSIVDGDLSICGRPIATAPPADIQLATSIAMERHQAINWLHDASAPFSETDAST